MFIHCRLRSALTPQWRQEGDLRLVTMYPCVVYEDDTEHQWSKTGTSTADIRAKEPVCLVARAGRYQLLVKCDQKSPSRCSTGLAIP